MRRSGIQPTGKWSRIDRGFRFRIPGWGSVPWKRVLTELRLVNYDYVLSYEHEDVVMSREDGMEKTIEYSLCQQFAHIGDVRELCRKAVALGVGVVCVNPVWVSLASRLVYGNDIELSGNVGFPFGSHHTEVKVLETRRALEDGATQIDMAINVGALRSGEDTRVEDDIRAVVQAANGRIVKTIIETWVLNRDEKERACKICESAGAGLVKTTTGVRTQYLQNFQKGRSERLRRTLC
jgi:deoxyribose-phosphate aldolase